MFAFGTCPMSLIFGWYAVVYCTASKMSYVTKSPPRLSFQICGVIVGTQVLFVLGLGIEKQVILGQRIPETTSREPQGLKANSCYKTPKRFHKVWGQLVQPQESQHIVRPTFLPGKVQNYSRKNGGLTCTHCLAPPNRCPIQEGLQIKGINSKCQPLGATGGNRCLNHQQTFNSDMFGFSDLSGL